MLRRSSLVECVSVLPGNRCLQNVEFFFLRQYVQPCLLKNPKYTFYTIKNSLKLAYYTRVPGFSGIGRTREGTRLQDHLCALC
jgi:hypothetical protein